MKKAMFGTLKQPPAGLFELTLEPTTTEQLTLELLNDIRENPTSYGTSINTPLLDLNGNAISPSYPLAFDARLIASARAHSDDMVLNNYFSHNDQQGNDPGVRITAEGYSWIGWGESIAQGYPSPQDCLQALLIDQGIPDLGHRLHLLSATTAHRAIGVGFNPATSFPNNRWTFDTALTTDYSALVCGVVFNDDGSGKYTEGSGVSGVTITAISSGAFYQERAFNTGGYTIALPPGDYTITASGGGLKQPLSQRISVSSVNLRLNFIVGKTTIAPVPTNRAEGARFVSRCQEHIDSVVVNAYRNFLKRIPAQEEVIYWRNLMQTGFTDEKLEDGFISSSEYISTHGGMGVGWLTSLYNDVLGRSPNQTEMDYWVERIHIGYDPFTIAYGFTNSQERASKHVFLLYASLLRRQASDNEAAYWTQEFVHGASDEDLIAGITSSDEYYTAVCGGLAFTWAINLYMDVLHRQPTSMEIAQLCNMSK